MSGVGPVATSGGIYQALVVLIAVVALQNEWYGVAEWAFGTIIIGAVIAGIAAKVTEEWSAFPIVGGAANVVGTIVGILLRFDVWAG